MVYLFYSQNNKIVIVKHGRYFFEVRKGMWALSIDCAFRVLIGWEDQLRSHDWLGRQTTITWWISVQVNHDRTKVVPRHTHFHMRCNARFSGIFKEMRGSLSINALRACVYIYIRQLSSFRAPTLWFIDLTVATYHIQYTFLSLCQCCFTENGQDTKILVWYSYDTKMAADGY